MTLWEVGPLARNKWLRSTFLRRSWLQLRVTLDFERQDSPVRLLFIAWQKAASLSVDGFWWHGVMLVTNPLMTLFGTSTDSN